MFTLKRKLTPLSVDDVVRLSGTCRYQGLVTGLNYVVDGTINVGDDQLVTVKGSSTIIRAVHLKLVQATPHVGVGRFIDLLSSVMTEPHRLTGERWQWVLCNRALALDLLSAEIDRARGLTHPVSQEVRVRNQHEEDVWERALEHSAEFARQLGLSESDIQRMERRDDVVLIQLPRGTAKLIAKSTCGPNHSGWRDLLQIRGNKQAIRIGGGTGEVQVLEDEEFLNLTRALTDPGRVRVSTERVWP